MAKKKKKKKQPKVYHLALGADFAILLMTRFSEKSKAKSERKFSRKQKHKGKIL